MIYCFNLCPDLGNQIEVMSVEERLGRMGLGTGGHSPALHEEQEDEESRPVAQGGGGGVLQSVSAEEVHSAPVAPNPPGRAFQHSNTVEVRLMFFGQFPLLRMIWVF